MDAFIVDHPSAPFRRAHVPDPVPGAGELVVRVRAVAVNPLDAKIRAGAAAHARQPLPSILGIDAAGVVDAVGPEVTAFAVGDQVFGMACGVGGIPGALAERVVVDSRLVARTPPELSVRDAAALPLVAITAWEGLVDQARVAPGATVLIQGASGGVGHVAVQLARARGATVWAAAGAARRGQVEALGAHWFDEAAELPPFDIVYDTAGGTELDAAFRRVRRGGHVVSCLGWGTHALAPLSFKAATYSGVFTLLPLLTGEGRAHHGEILRRVADLGIRARVDEHRYDGAAIEAAFDAVVHRTANGKVVIESPIP